MIRALRTTPIAIPALFWGSLASAQGWVVGVKGGFSHSIVSSSQEFVWHAADPTGSVFARRSLTDRLAIQPEMGLQRRGAVSTVAGSTLTLSADYLDVPVMVQVHPRRTSIEPFLSAGPSLTYRLRCTLAFEGGGISTSDTCEAAAGQFNRLDVTLAAGAGVNLRIGTTSVQVESRISTGVRANVLPIDVQARTAGVSATAGVATSLAGGLSQRPRGREPRRDQPLPALRIKDANIAAMIMAFANTDISYARMVARRTGRPDLKGFSEQMLAAHARVYRMVTDLLARLDIGAEDNGASLHLRDESADQRDPLYFVNGPTFDSSYVEGEARLQREFLASIDDVMLPRARSAEMRALLAQLRPAVAARLADAERLRADVLARPLIASRDAAGAGHPSPPHR